jgi:hypothetical protein
MTEIINLHIRKYQLVPANDVAIDEWTPANGENFFISSAWGNAAYVSAVKLELKFGDQILFATHGTSKEDVNEKFVGDGIKKVQLRLVNDSDYPETIGGGYEGCRVI